MASQKELQQYLAQKIYENAPEIAPELIHYVGGDSVEEIDRSIARVKASTAELVASISGGWQTELREGTTATSFDPAMSMDQYAAFRQTIGLSR